MSRIRFALYLAAFWMILPTSRADDTTTCPKPAESASADTKLAQAKQLRLSGNLDGATALVDGVLQQQPGNFKALYNRGLILTDQQRFDQAEKALKEAAKTQERCASTEMKPDFSVYNTLGWVQMVKGDTSNAIQNFNTALSHESELSPASVSRTKSNLGYLYFSTGDFDKARSLLEGAQKMGNPNAAATLRLVDHAQAVYEESKKSGR